MPITKYNILPLNILITPFHRWYYKQESEKSKEVGHAQTK